MALSDAMRERLGVDVATEVNDDGILFHFPRSNRDLPLDVIQQLTPAEARERILHQLPSTELFGAHFRMNAARALLLPRAHGAKRTPFWLQRLKARTANAEQRLEVELTNKAHAQRALQAIAQRRDGSDIAGIAGDGLKGADTALA